MKSQQWRGLDFFNPDQDHPNVLIIGCGHIGSYLAFALARMGVKEITVVDHDMVEPHNLPNQFFAESLVKDLPDDAKLPKVTALQQTINYLIPSANIIAIPSRVEDAKLNFSNYKCVMMAVDNMDVRKWIWNEVQMASGVKLLIDARTGGQYANMFGIIMGRSEHEEIYRENLYDNSDVPPLPCTGTSIIDVSFAVVADCIQKYRQFVKNRRIVGIHTFHDGIVGTTSLMRMDTIKTEVIRDIEEPGIIDGDNVDEESEDVDGTN